MSPSRTAPNHGWVILNRSTDGWGIATDLYDGTDFTVRRPRLTVFFEDREPPALEVSVDPDTLWPANHKYMEVQATVTATDVIDPSPVIRLVSVTSNEPDDTFGNGDCATVDDIQILDDTTFRLRAERAGSGDGRVYIIIYEAGDASGNTVTASATVSVPLNQSGE